MVVAVAIAVMVLWIYLLSARSTLFGPEIFDFIDTRAVPERWPSISVIIPARNESDMLRFTLPFALSFYYPQVEVILVDDCSEDSTAETAAQVAQAQERPLRVVRGLPPPEGWKGKPWALQQGLEASTGEWLLFTDADVVHRRELLRDLVRIALTQDFQMVSLMALLRTETFWDRLLLPPFLFFFYVMYPFHRVKNPRSRTAAAAGGCLLVERAALEKAGGLAAVRGAWIDDLALAAVLKQSGARIYLGATVQAQSFRRYGTLGSIWRMVARSAFTQLRGSWALVALALASLTVLFGVPAAGALAVFMGLSGGLGFGLASMLGAVSGFSLGFMILAYAPAIRLYRLPLLWALTLPAAALLYGAMTLSSALSHLLGQRPRWKGRSG